MGTGLVWANSTVGCAQHLIKTEGVKGLFRGFTATASRDGPGMALYYIIYDVAKKTIPGWSDKLDEHTGKPKHTALQVKVPAYSLASVRAASDPTQPSPIGELGGKFTPRSPLVLSARVLRLVLYASFSVD